MSPTLEEFRAKFRVDELTVYKSAYWTWSMRPVHSTLGSGILSLNRFCPRLGDITEEESRDLGATCKQIEHALDAAFAPQKMNYIMLMMVDRHLHFHVLPRYSETKHMGELSWNDSGWPKPPALGDYEDRAESPVLLEIRDLLKRSLA